MRFSHCRTTKLASLLVSARLLLVSSLRLQGRFLRMESFGSTRSFNTLQIGLTGSIGMGKSTISNQLIKLGIPLFDADREVHRLYAPNGAAVEPIRAAFPDAIVDGAVDRNKLTAKIIEDPSALKTIEQIVHPLVVAGRENFYARACAERQLMVVYDIPLLFENITKYNVDYIVVATAAADVQRRRVLERPGMTEEKFQAILAKQVPDAAKRERADFLVHTDYEGYSEAKAQLGRIIEKIIEKNPMLWEEWKQCGLSEPVDDDDITTRASLTVSARSVRSAIDMVVFDLDDTLVPVTSQLKRATEAMKAHMAEHMPQTLRVVDSQLRHVMKSVMNERPLIAHDLTEVRRAALLEISREFGEDAQVNSAMEVFFATRSDVCDNFYEDTEACLEWFHNLGVKIGILTNGSADLTKCELLRKYLSFTFTAADVGVPKPSPVAFLACAQVAKVPAHRILYVGDSYECDVQGANNAGMVSALLLRKDYSTNAVNEETTLTKEELAQQWRESHPMAHIALPSLRVADLEAGFGEYFSGRGV